MRTAQPALWRNRDYRLLWTGNLVSSIGNATVLIALPLLVLALTGRPLQTGGVAAAETISYIAMSLPAGVVVDRYPRRRLLVLAAMTSMLATAIIPVAYYLHRLAIGEVYAVAVLVGCAGALDQIAQVAILPRIAGAEHVGTASAQFELIFSLSALAGPPLAGLLLSGGHLAVPFIIDSLSFGALAVAAGLIRQGLEAERPAERARRRDELLAGIRTLTGHRNLRALSAITLVGDMLFAGITVLMTVLEKSRGAPPAIIGAVFAIAAVGGVIGSLAATRFKRRAGLARSVMLRSWTTAVLFPLLATSVPPIVLGVPWALINIMIAFMNVTQMQLIIGLAPAEVLGRTQSVVTFASFAVLPIGAVLTGVLLQYVGPPGTVLIFSAVLALVAIYSSVSRDLRAPPV
jgi:MFS family permease